MSKRLRIAGKFLAAAAALAGLGEAGMIVHTERITDTYSAFYPTQCAPVSEATVSQLQRPFLRNSGKRFVVSAVAQDGDTVRGRSFIISHDDAGRLGIPCDGQPHQDFRRSCELITKGQFINGITLPRSYRMDCTTATQAQSNAMAQAAQKGVDSGMVVRMYRP